MIRDKIRKDILETINNSPFDSTQGKQLIIDNVEIELNRSKDPKHGDFATNLPLKVSREVKQSPMEVAKILADSLKDLPYIKKLEAKEPGFINFFIKPEIWQKEVEKVLKEGLKYGSNNLGDGKKARVEFVSANPTGPLHFGNARGGPIGDAIASVLEFSGYKVLREYYNNDVGVQIEKLGQTIINVVAGNSLEDQEYKGQYIDELTDKLRSLIKSKINLNTSTTNISVDFNRFGKEAVKILLKENLADCEEMGIKFGKVYSESEFIESGKTKEAIKFLEDKGVLKKKDGATWFAPSDEFLKDRETVVIKSDGTYTYFANDIAYHRLKFDEKYDLAVDVLGANHHGHVPRLNAAISALGFDVSNFKVILYQWVRFRKDGKPLSMSKRAGSFITAREVLEEIGRDALRFMLLMYDADSPFEFDIDLAREKSSENPVYYVQYAYARISSILAKSNGSRVVLGSETTPESLGTEFSGRSDSEEFSDSKRRTSDSGQARMTKTNYKLLSTKYELDLIKQISRLPELVLDISKSFAVNQLTSYTIELADAFHKFYENCTVLSEDGELTKSRLALCEASKITLANTFRLLGISSPEKM